MIEPIWTEHNMELDDLTLKQIELLIKELKNRIAQLRLWQVKSHLSDEALRARQSELRTLRDLQTIKS